MKKIKYCKQLLEYQKGNFSLQNFFGGRWILLKAIILILSITVINRGGAINLIIGSGLIGYVIGKVSAGFNTYRAIKSNWDITEGYINWDKVEETIKNKS